MPTYGKNGKLKKVLRWADNSGIDLEEIRYFEVMPGERGVYLRVKLCQKQNSHLIYLSFSLLYCYP